MLALHDRLLFTPILSLQTGAPLARTKQPIIDPRELKIVAFYCEGPHITEPAVLHTDDIRELSGMGIIVDDADSIMAPDQLVRLQEVIDFHFELIGKQIIDTRKRKLGKVEDYSVDLDSFYIIKIKVRQSLLKNFMGANMLIDRTQIVEINDKHIVVNANEVKAPTKKPAGVQQIIENPFRGHPQPGPNTIESNRN